MCTSGRQAGTCLVLDVFNLFFFFFFGWFLLAGRLLASFRSSFDQLVPDGASEVYVKKTQVLEAPSLA